MVGIGNRILTKLVYESRLHHEYCRDWPEDLSEEVGKRHDGLICPSLVTAPQSRRRPCRCTFLM